MMGFSRYWSALLLAAAPAPATAQNAPSPPDVERIAPVEDPAAIPLIPDAKVGAERWDRIFGGQRVARNVSRPTLTPFLPDPARATGASVIVIPGGGFQFVSMDNEGWPVAKRLAAQGIAAFVLKYRTNATPDDEAGFMRAVAATFGNAGKPTRPEPSEPRATADALAALGMVRARAAEWRVDPARVGIIGFSAGAMTAMQVVMTAPAAERPAWFGYIYGPMLPVRVPADAPPMFAALALDDGLFGRQGFGVVESWHAANRPVEFHAYERGDHGFGLGHPGTTTTLMLDEYLAWLSSHGWLTRAGR